MMAGNLRKHAQARTWPMRNRATVHGSVLVAMLAVSVAGCHRDATPAPQAAPVVHRKAPVKRGPTAEELTSGMVEAAVQGKSPLDVSLKFELLSRPKLGQPLQINLALLPRVSGGPAVASTSSTEGFDSPVDAAAFEVPEVQAGEVYRQTVKLTPNMEGVLIVGETVTMKHDEVTDTKVFSIPVIVER